MNDGDTNTPAAAQPWAAETQAPDPSEAELAALKKEADDLGVQYAANIGADTLRSRIEEHKNASQQNPDDAPDETENTPGPSAVLEGEQATLQITTLVSGGLTVEAAKAVVAGEATLEEARDYVARQRAALEQD